MAGTENNNSNKFFEMRGMKESLEKQIKSGLSWFYWIAALSFINTIIIYTGKQIQFVVGFGITMIIAGVSTHPAFAITITALICGFFAFIGYIGRKIKVFIFVGIILYIFDSLLFLMVQDWFSIGFHIFALFFIIRALVAIHKLEKIEEDEKQQQQTTVIS